MPKTTPIHYRIAWKYRPQSLNTNFVKITYE